MSHKYVYLFKEGNKDMRNLLGGKGANLAEMTGLGLPVPQGFTITTEACTQYYEDGRKINDDIQAQIMEYITKMEEITGKKFGDKENPLLVSVRSGARASMPGMMDTILNLGLNEDVVEVMSKKSGNPRWAWDCYRRFIQMYSDVVMEVGKKYFEVLIDEMKEKKGVTQDVELTAEDLAELAEQFKAEYMHRQDENEDDDKMLTDINNKIAVDQELTPEELRYLQNKNPSLYQKVKNIENEKKQYEKDLKNCKTKEEVERLKMNKVSSALSAIKSAESDPNLPESAKLAVAQGELRRMNALNKILAKFVERGEYDKLPAEQEVLEVEKQLKEAERAEEEKVFDVSETENTEKAGDTSETESENKEFTENAPENISEDKPTKAEIELSPEAQKIKRSKAKKAYDEVKEKYIPQQINVFSE